MRSYRINTDRLVNQLVPHYLGGRKLILYLQSLLQPLNTLNIRWKEWADEKRMEAAMTSQVIMLEYYLNKKFGKYLADRSQRIVIADGIANGVPMYRQNVNPTEDVVLYNVAENGTKTAFRWKDEKVPNDGYSFTINCPAIRPNTITQNEMTGMIRYAITKYCLAGKKFNVIYI